MTVYLKNGFLKQQAVSATSSTRPVKLLVVNLMPNKLETERQFVHLFSHLSLDVEVTFLRMASHHSKHTSETALQSAYAVLDDVYDQHFDGMVVTGAPVEQIQFEDVDYWPEFKALLDWRNKHVQQSILECWAAQAGIYADFGINKRVIPSKLFGVYRCEINARTALTAGFKQLSMPQSRHATLENISDPRLNVLASDPEAGPVVLASEVTHSTYISGHPEYETQTLNNEFHRDQEKGLPIQLPVNYFSQAKPTNTWQDDSFHLYDNWIHSLRVKVR
ncbi:homoserine O-acetyltransferase/O-succinyltransferase family protein [Secundilactobacillus folii]|uniref:Homoserine O-acetyltransferase n=1 Tax=Secundilactobacillus folii TaxID=2678357 RepID=A0A7X2XUX7_9LACO|nr:homoserine O-succinyltransferase [Secundilactobacillus folii]MTV82099.1 homoserine O-succinyltransferase [Secundilactobacillus folii]